MRSGYGHSSFILCTRKPRLREVKEVVQGHRASKGQGWWMTAVWILGHWAPQGDQGQSPPKWSYAGSGPSLTSWSGNDEAQ